jgi:hypothetical protein
MAPVGSLRVSMCNCRYALVSSGKKAASDTSAGSSRFRIKSAEAASSCFLLLARSFYEDVGENTSAELLNFSQNLLDFWPSSPF